MNMDAGFSLSDLKGLVRRRIWLIAGTAWGALLSGILLASILPNTYAAFATLLVEPPQISERLVEGRLEGTELNQRLHLMTMQILSRPRLSKIIDELDLYQEESKEMTREEVIGLMRSEINVEPVLPELGEARKSREPEQINTFRLAYTSESPQVAAAVANRLANDFIEEHIRERVNLSEDTSAFIESQLQTLQGRLAEVETRIAQIKAENPGKLPDDLAYNQRSLERNLSLINQAERELDLARSDEAFYRQQLLASTDLGDPRDVHSPARRVEALEVQLAAFAAQGYTDKHPDVLSARQEIENLRNRMEADAADEDGTAMSLAQQNAEAERRRAELRINAIQEEIERLQLSNEETQERIAETPRVAERLDALQREYTHLYGSYQDFSNRRLEAGVAANVERRQKGEQFRVLESAYPDDQPISPNRPLIMSLALMMGIAFGGALSVLLEGMDSSYHAPRSLQSALRIPVLAAVPSILFDADRAAQRRRAMRFATVGAMLSAVVLVGSVGGYYWTNMRGRTPAAEEVAPPEGGAEPAAETPPQQSRAPFAASEVG